MQPDIFLDTHMTEMHLCTCFFCYLCKTYIWTSTYYFFADNRIRFPLEVIDFENSNLDGYLLANMTYSKEDDKISLSSSYSSRFVTEWLNSVVGSKHLIVVAS